VKNTTDILKKRLKGLGNEMGKASVLAAGIAVRERSWGLPQDVKYCTIFFLCLYFSLGQRGALCNIELWKLCKCGNLEVTWCNEKLLA
jgi:hypothetical protein